MTSTEYSDAASPAESEIDRWDTGLRIPLTILFAIISGVLDSIVGLVVAFCLAWTFITKKPPTLRLRVLVNRIISYQYRLARYMTYNESRVPFPFSDFPEPLEAPSPDPSSTSSTRESLGLDLDREPRSNAESEDAPE